MAKLNSFYWKLEGEPCWFTWREVCEYRRRIRWASTTAKILISEYERQLTTHAADSCPQGGVHEYGTMMIGGIEQQVCRKCGNCPLMLVR